MKAKASTKTDAKAPRPKRVKKRGVQPATTAFDALVIAFASNGDILRERISKEEDEINGDIEASYKYEAHRAATKWLKGGSTRRAVPKFKITKVPSIHWGWYQHDTRDRSLSVEETVTVEWHAGSADLKVKLAPSHLRRLNKRIAEHVALRRRAATFPSRHASIRDWQKATIRELLALNPGLVDELIGALEKAAKKARTWPTVTSIK